MPKVLEGVRVLDWSMWYVGPEAAALLADLGANVIHIEERGKGDPVRGVIAFLGIPMDLPGGRNVLFEHHNRNKRSLAIDLKKPQGREVVYRLVEKVDVFLTNFRRAAVQRAGLDYQSLSQINPRLVYASSSCFGEEGPDGASPGLDLVACARSGIMMACGDAHSQEPTWIASGMGDEIAAIILAFGVLAALHARDRYGVGQEVITSQLASLMKLQAQSIMVNLLRGSDVPRQDRREARNPLYNYYRCRDGRWIALGLVRHLEWVEFCQAIGYPDIAQDPRFDRARKREENCRELNSLLEELFLTRPAAEWAELLRRADLIHSPVNAIADLPNDPQVVANGYILDYDHPALGRVKFLGSPLKFSQTPMELSSPAPNCGEHTEEVLLEAGYSWEDIARLKEEEVIP